MRWLAALILVAFVIGEVAVGAGLIDVVPPEAAPIVTLAAGYLFGHALLRRNGE